MFLGGGDYANGRFMFDAEGNLWSGRTGCLGSQSGVNHSIGGGVVKLSPNGKALSPDITGFTGMGIDGVGWGTAMTKDKVWITSFDGSILLLDFDGHPIGKESDFPMAGQMGQLMGVGIAANGDVWIADGSKNQLYFFPGGRVEEKPSSSGAEVSVRHRHRRPKSRLGRQLPGGLFHPVPGQRSRQLTRCERIIRSRHRRGAGSPLKVQRRSPWRS